MGCGAFELVVLYIYAAYPLYECVYRPARQARAAAAHLQEWHMLFYPTLSPGQSTGCLVVGWFRAL